MKRLSLLGGLSPQAFLRDYWHKRPLLVRAAIPGFAPLLARSALLGLAAQMEVESRLVSHYGRKWKVQSGPFTCLPSGIRNGWTLLVQGVNLYDDAADRLLQQFRFIPDARLDDLMISYATNGGGVGPHFDSYDVFLLQAHGQRRWRISAQKDLELLDDMPLKILKHFQAEQEFVLNPGDMLYLPPHYAHEGTAIGECMTYSIGFRAPSFQELGEAFLQFMADTITLPGRYADPDLRASSHPAAISRTMVTRIAAELHKVRFTDDDIMIFLGEYLSEPKANVFFDPPVRPLTFARFIQAAMRRGIVLSPKTRMLYRGRHAFINGESLLLNQEDKQAIARLADRRTLNGQEIALATGDVLETFHAWYRAGWVALI